MIEASFFFIPSRSQTEGLFVVIRQTEIIYQLHRLYITCWLREISTPTSSKRENADFLHCRLKDFSSNEDDLREEVRRSDQSNVRLKQIVLLELKVSMNGWNVPRREDIQYAGCSFSSCQDLLSVKTASF